MRKLGLLAIAMWVGLPAQAIQTAYLSFQEPSNWSCELAQGVWVCQSNKEIDRKEAVILSIAAEATDWDTLTNYEQYLKRQKVIRDQTGKEIQSKITYTRRRNLNGVWWVDSLHRNSELPGFWTRYLATIHDSKKLKLAILVTYIVSEERYSKLAPEFERMVSSLKPNEDFTPSTQQGNELPWSGKLGPLKKLIPELVRKPKPPPQIPDPKGPGKFSPTTIAIIFGVLAAIMILLRRRKKPQKKPPNQMPPQNRPPTQRLGG